MKRWSIFLSTCMSILCGPVRNTSIFVQDGAPSFLDPGLKNLSLNWYQEFALSDDDPKNIFTPGTYALDEFYAKSKQLCQNEGFRDESDCLMVQAGEDYLYSLKREVFHKVLESGILEAFFPEGFIGKLSRPELTLFSIAIKRFGGIVHIGGRGSFEAERWATEFLTGAGNFARQTDSVIPKVRPSVDKFMKDLLLVSNLDTLD